MSRCNDLTGHTFGNLTVVARTSNAKNGRAQWFCLCSCGNTKISIGKLLSNGHVKSCGCLGLLNKNRLILQGTKHSLCGTAVHHAWRNMMSRCYAPNRNDFKLYGGRGIIVDKKWHSLENFFADMGHPPEKHSLDRINNSLGYSKENCRWADNKTQARNKRNNRYVSFCGVRYVKAELIELCGCRNYVERLLRNGDAV